jgi:hypothetical protein
MTNGSFCDAPKVMAGAAPIVSNAELVSRSDVTLKRMRTLMEPPFVFVERNNENVCSIQGDHLMRRTLPRARTRAG